MVSYVFLWLIGACKSWETHLPERPVGYRWYHVTRLISLSTNTTLAQPTPHTEVRHSGRACATILRDTHVGRHVRSDLDGRNRHNVLAAICSLQGLLASMRPISPAPSGSIKKLQPTWGRGLIMARIARTLVTNALTQAPSPDAELFCMAH